MIAGVLILSMPAIASSANQYVQITANRVNIRLAPSTAAQIVATGGKGDIFELQDESQRWYQIHLFSGETRYIHKSLAAEVSYRPEAPDSISLRRQIFKALGDAQDRIKKEADAKYPPHKGLKKNIEYTHILRDKYMLEVVHQFEVQAPIYRRISIEGTQKGW